mmetsp:Transcript_8578/g.9826  ORF Transcript_8578/g.9826 Transcript_8578/m.9826 type:complete len:558 (+) Transcript_8578:107-1780(+)|eukprot:CAMPEP_0194144362 /NCGR_PEP_ID=MMETSP0152-20130528/13431_1 /TAXON_ID=1049557 /ORGANISM="Thalassiothrix antarctica, Strain L6-D1" /LENGTH=557 /DNA_ID=CAMNT_0038844191 /DNA_START=35 /DNA_END=1708 /DNA_ORIENTATION=-
MRNLLTVTVLLVAPLWVGASSMQTSIDDLNAMFERDVVNIRRNKVIFDKRKLEKDRQGRMERQHRRRERARFKLNSIKPDLSKMELLSKEELQKAHSEGHTWVRRASWNSNSNYEAYGYAGMADPSQEYDKWQQAYRMLGGFIDCDHSKDDDDHKSGDDEDLYEKEDACSRWMMWAAYVDPNYQGNGYDEYHGDTPVGELDCHKEDSDWVLLGVYREEFYQYIEQISKHLWAIDEYDYVVALAGLAYMTNADCFYVGDTNNGEAIYAGVAPKAKGKFEMALYTDDYCIEPNEDLGITFDYYGLTNNVQLQSQDGDDGGYNDDYITNWWESTQEYTLENLNNVYETFKYCTSCVDYPTYQDGYFIGDYGTDDDDLINQCWKFYSHDSFPCEADCIALGEAQGTIVSVNYGDVEWGEVLNGYYGSDEETSTESRWTRIMANIFVSFSFVVFIATFLAFAVARRSRHRERTSGRSRRLLEEDRAERRKSRRSNPEEEEDGIHRTKEYRSERSSRSGKSRSKSASRRSKSKSRGNTTYEPPSTKSKSGRSKSSSRRHIDDF